MTRRKKRLERRQAKREKRRKENLAENQNFKNVISVESLYKAAWQAAKGVKWKLSVQKFLFNILVNISKISKQLEELKDPRKGFIKFNICERGKVRHISSVHFDERVVQKSLCTNATIPILTYNLIADNGASQKGKGTHYAINRLSKQLSKYYRQYGNSG